MVLGSSTSIADTSKLTTADGWTKITTLPTAADIENNYYVFVDNSQDLMLGVGKGVNQNTKWYSLGVYYKASVEPTSAAINGMTWTLESVGSGFAMRNLEYSVSPFQTEWNAAWKFDTNDVYETANEWTEVRFAYSGGAWTIQNGKYPNSGYLGPWNDGNFTNGAECAANKSGNNIGKFQIYAISRDRFKQNLLDNASSSNPVDLTPWYVSNATFDGNSSDGWETSFSANASGWWGNHSFGNLGAENYQQVAEVKQTLTLPNGKYKVALQGASNKVSENQAYVFATQDGNTQKTYFTQSTVSTTDGEKWNDMQYNLLLMMQDRSYGQVQTPEVTVTNGSLTIGYKNESGHSWDVYDNFKLYCTGVDLSTYIAEFNAFRAKAEGLLTGVADGETKTTFTNAISTAAAAVEVATTRAEIYAQIDNLRSAVLTFISSTDGQFDITFLASQAYSDWKKKDGTAAGEVTWAVTNRGDWTFAESYESTCATTGTVLYQTVSGLPAGYYQVGMYAMAAYTSGRDFDSEATEGDADRSFAFAGNLDDASSILRTGIAIPFKDSFDFSELTTLDVNVHLSTEGNLTFGVQKDANGSNWHFAQIASIIYSNQPDLTNLKATRDALVAEAEGLLTGSSDYLTADQKAALQQAIDAGNAADDFDALNTVTLTTLPNAINTAKQQVAQAKAAIPTMIAALERFETDYNLADGTDYRRVTMSAEAWATLLNKVNAVSLALDDITQASTYTTIAKALTDQMDATDQSLRLFKNYKAMVDGTTALGIVGSYGADSNMDSDASEQTAITALNSAFDSYAAKQADNFDVSAFLGENLDFSAAEGAALNTANDNNIHAVTGWEVSYADADTWAVVQTNQNDNPDKLYIRKNWGSSATTFDVVKEKMLPVGKYQLSFSWNSKMANMTNRSAFTVGTTKTTIGKVTTAAETLNYDFEVTGQPQPFDLTFGFQKTGTGNTPAEIIVDDVKLTYTPTVIELLDNANNTQTIADNANVRSVVKLTGRTLYKDGAWNTLCLPFALALEGSPLEDATLMELDTESAVNGHKTGVEDQTLYLNFKSATSLRAHVPYIIKWESSSNGNLTEPSFPGVTIASGTPTVVTATGVTFQGTYAPITYDTENKSVLLMGSGNNLYYPDGTEDASINAFRAYFQLADGITAGTPATSGTTGLSRFVLNFGNGETGLHAPFTIQGSTGDDATYDLLGRRLSNRQLSNGQMPKGVYIVNGKKLVIK